MIIKSEPVAEGKMITGREISRYRRESRQRHQYGFQLSNQVVGDWVLLFKFYLSSVPETSQRESN